MPLEDVFQIPRGVADGSCTEDRIASIRTWWQDCYDLLTHALTALENIRRTDRELQRHLAAFYNVKFTPLGKAQGDILPEVVSQIRTVVWVMEGATRVGPLQKLYCNGPWLHETEQAYDDWGHIRRDEKGRPMSIRDDPGIRRDFPDVQEGTPEHWKIYLYWSADFATYMWLPESDRLPEDSMHRRHVCVPRPDSLPFAFTTSFPHGKALTLCPAVWTESASYYGGGDSVRQALARSDIHMPGRRVEWTMPRTKTLLHELFHFAHEEGTTPEGSNNFEGVLEDRANEPWKHPETNVLFVWAYYLSSTVEPRLSWATGISSKPKVSWTR